MESRLNLYMDNPGLEHIVMEIFSYLDYKSLTNCQLVSHRWKKFIKESKPIWRAQVNKTKFRVLKNYTHIWRANVNQITGTWECRFETKFPLWKIIINNMKTQSIQDMITFVKYMDYYFKTDWKQAKEPRDPVFDAILNKNVELLEVVLKGPYVLPKYIRRLVRRNKNSCNIKSFTFIKDNIQSIYDTAAERSLLTVLQLILYYAYFNNISLNHGNQHQEGMTAFHHACENELIDIVKVFLRFGGRSFDIDVKNNIGMTALQICCDSSLSNTNLAIVDLLLKHGSDVNANGVVGLRALHLAVQNGNTNIVKRLCQHPSINVNAKDDSDQTPLHIACSYGFADVVESLCEHPFIDINAKDKDGGTPLLLAVEILCKHNEIDINARDEDNSTPILHTRSLDVLKILCKHPNIDVNAKDEKGFTALHEFCCGTIDSETLECIKLLLSVPSIDVNIRDKYGRTPLHFLSDHDKNEDVVKLLLTNPSIDVNARDEKGFTALHGFCCKEIDSETLECIKLLLSVPSFDVNVRDKYGRTPLHLLCDDNKNEDVVKLLLTHPLIDINIRDVDDMTPLLFAYDGYQHNLVKCLMKHMKMNDHSTNEGLELLEYAFLKNDDEMISILCGFEISDKKRKHEFEKNIAKIKRLN